MIEEIKQRLQIYKEDEDKFKWLPYEKHVEREAEAVDG